MVQHPSTPSANRTIVDVRLKKKKKKKTTSSVMLHTYSMLNCIHTNHVFMRINFTEIYV